MIKVKADLNTDTFKFKEFEVKVKGDDAQVHTELTMVLDKILKEFFSSLPFYRRYSNIMGILDVLYEVDPVATAEVITNREERR